MFVYHYHAMKQTGFATVMHLDGIAILVEPVLTNESYIALKQLIVDGQGVHDTKGLTICSLSLLESGDGKK